MNTQRDQNHVTSKLGVLCTDGMTLIPIAINPINGGVKVDTISVISFTPGSIDFRDENYRACWIAQNSVSGLPIPIFVNANGAVLMDIS